MSMRKKLIAVAVIAVAGIGSGVAVAATSSSGINLGAPAIPETPGVSSQLAASYPVLARSRTASDALPSTFASFGSLGIGAQLGVNTDLSQEITAPDGSQMWLVPGAAGTCLELAAGQGACGTNTRIEADGIVVILVPPNGGPETMLGIAPSNATVKLLGAHGATSTDELQTSTVNGTKNVFSFTSSQAQGIAIKVAGKTADRDTFPPAY